MVVIFGENISFDHYFGTYPTAVNPPGETRFLAHPGTPGEHSGDAQRSLVQSSDRQSEFEPANGAGAANPFRLNRILEHEDNEMMRPYEVVAAGAPAKR
ncbi:MAG TPA: alkaline phosphatase family protein [Bryobacteraceae bacterium]